MVDPGFLERFKSMSSPGSTAPTGVNAIRARLDFGPSYDLLQAVKAMQDEQAAEAAKSKPTFLSGFFDLLSIPLYGIGNALDEALGGHQSDNSDSVGEDILKTVGGIGTGLVKGIGAGARGATSMVDTLPGIDFSDDWQKDPTDKTRFGDVYTRYLSGMKTSEAMKPERWEEAKANIQEKYDSGNWPDWLPNPSTVDLSDPNAQEEFIRKMKLFGISADIAFDPTTYLGFGVVRNAKNADAILEGVNAARSSELIGDISKVPDTFRVGADAPKAFEMPFSAEISSSLGSNLLPGRVKLPDNLASITAPKAPKVNAPDIVPTTPPAIASPSNEDLFNTLLREVLDEGHRVDDVVASVGIQSGAKPKIQGAPSLSVAQQKALVKEITATASSGGKNWVYEAANVLGRHPNINFENAERFLDLIHKSNRAGKKMNPAAFASTLAARISEDAAKSGRPGDELIDAVRKASVEKIIKPGESGLNPAQATLANKLIAKYSPEIVGGKLFGTAHSPEALRTSIARGDTAVYSGPKQANIWNGLTARLGWAGADKFPHAVRIMRAINNHFESLGAIPHSAASISGKKGITAVPLRLDQVAEAIGPDVMGMNKNLVTKILAGEPSAMATLTLEQQNAIKALRESSAITAMSAAKTGVQEAENAASAIATSVASAPRKQEALATLPSLAANSAAASGAGDAASKFAKQYMNSRLNAANPVDDLFKSTAFDTTRALATNSLGRTSRLVDTYYAARVNNAVAKANQLPPLAELGKISGPAARVTDWLGAKFNAAYGLRDLNPIMRQHQAAALTTMAARAKYINQLAAKYPPKDVDLWHEAFRAAQMDSLTTGQVSELQKEISRTMENLFGGSGLKANAIADATVVGRTRLGMKELNEQMTRFGLNKYQFTNGKKVKDALGNVHDLSRGADWLNSWQLWDIKKPYDFLHRVQQAVEATVRQKNMMDDIAARFGSTKKHGNVKYGIDHPRLNGYFFSEEGARQGQVFMRALKDLNTPNPKSMQYVDHVISKLKAALTIYIPSHHWTNLIGDTTLNWLAGVNDPRRYDQAIKVMRSQRGRYGDIIAFDKGVAGPHAELQAIARSVLGDGLPGMNLPTLGLEVPGLAVNAVGNAVATTMRNGTKVTNDMLYVAAMQRGILPSARVLEEVTQDVTSVLDKFGLPGKFKGKGQAAVHLISEWRDHVPRLAQFIDSISKSGKPFNQAADDAAAAVRKWHPDGLDLTKFERDVMKRVFPFYSWTRKAIPLAIQSALTKPGKVMAYPHLMEAIALSNGITPGQGTIGEFPTDQMFPDWLRERGIGPVAGGPGNYTIVNPSTPVLDVMTMLGHPGQTALDMLNPLAKVPIEMANEQTLGKHTPIENNLDYIARQIPGISHAGRVSGYYGVSDSVKNSEEQKRLNLLNLLFGAKATQSGIYQKSAQFDLRDYLKSRRDQ